MFETYCYCKISLFGNLLAQELLPDVLLVVVDLVVVGGLVRVAERPVGGSVLALVVVGRFDFLGRGGLLLGGGGGCLFLAIVRVRALVRVVGRLLGLLRVRVDHRGDLLLFRVGVRVGLVRRDVLLEVLVVLADLLAQLAHRHRVVLARRGAPVCVEPKLHVFLLFS